MSNSGIYAIKHAASGKVYVGSAASLSSRKKCHLHRLRNGQHHSIILQRAWDKYGEPAFEFVVLEMVSDRANLVPREQFWLDFYNSANPAFGYNIAKIAGSRLGTRQSEEARAKMSRAYREMPAERKAALSELRAAARRGWKHPPETIERMRGKVRTPETREKLSAALRGKPKSPSHRAALAASLTGKKYGPQTPEQIAKRVAATRATKEAKRAAQ